MVNVGTIKSLQLYDLHGQLIASVANHNSLNLNDIASGIYFITVQLNSGEFLRKKIIKE